MSRDDFGDFPRGGAFSDHGLEDMRAQMEKEREAFFRDRGDWPSDRPPGLFSRPRTSFGGFPSAGGGPGFRRFPAGECGEESSSSLGSLPARSADRWGSHRTNRPDDDSCSDHSSNSSGGGDNRPDSIPIKVFHQKSGLPQQRPRYTGSGRNTTELPGRPSAAAANGESPRLERAHSEPPNKFTQRLNLGRPGPQHTTIPENGEAGGGGGGDGGLGSLEGSTAAVPGLKIPIKPSASAPSVSDSQQQPVPPPRRSPPRHQHSKMSGSAAQNSNNTAVPLASSGNVRHIPIFVEGRPEPIFNTSSNSSGPAQPQPEMSFPKPSDYYPPNVQRIRSRDSECGTPTDFQFHPFGDPGFRTHTPPTGFRPSMTGSHPTVVQQPTASAAAASYVEPTTPMGPPPGPIPMGYVPNPGVPKEVIQEPTTPQGPPPGPIPMGYVPSAVPEPATAESTRLVAPPSGAIPMPCDPSLVSHTPQQVPEQLPSEADADKQSTCSANPPPPPPPPSSSTRSRQSTSSPVGTAAGARTTDDVDHGGPGAQTAPPIVNVIPIRVEQGGGPRESSRSASTSRPPSESAVAEERRGTMPRSPAPPRKGGEGDNAALINKLDTIRQEVEKLGERIQNFKGSRAEKEYLYLDDMLTKQLIALDGIDTAGKEEIRQLRKDSIAFVNSCLSRLDEKATEHSAAAQQQQQTPSS